MGVVDLAVDPDGNQVALKRIPLVGTLDEATTLRRRVRREAELLARVSHPNVVPILDLVDDDNDVVLVLPYFATGSLADVVRRSGPLDPEAGEAVFTILLGALRELHSAGIVHRDIKPSNILFDDTNQPLLADFGAAMSRDVTAGLTATGQVLGTPQFMAPEQAAGHECDDRTDVFSLAATTLWALTGDGPYGEGDPRAVMAKAADGRIGDVPPRLPAPFRRCLRDALRADASRRPSAADLLAVLGGQRSRRASGPRRSRQAGGRLGVALAVGALAVVAILMWNRPDDETSTLPTTTECTPLTYQPCGEEPAPNTDGRRCTAEFADYDGLVENGCEAEPDDVDGAELSPGEPLAATLVPSDDTDEYYFEVRDETSLLCEGSVSLSVTAPNGMSLRVDVWQRAERLATERVGAGDRSQIDIVEPGCPGDDSGVLEVRVSPIGDERSGDQYRLTVEGTF